MEPHQEWVQSPLLMLQGFALILCVGVLKARLYLWWEAC